MQIKFFFGTTKSFFPLNTEKWKKCCSNEYISSCDSSNYCYIETVSYYKLLSYISRVTNNFINNYIVFIAIVCFSSDFFTSATEDSTSVEYLSQEQSTASTSSVSRRRVPNIHRPTLEERAGFFIIPGQRRVNRPLRYSEGPNRRLLIDQEYFLPEFLDFIVSPPYRAESGDSGPPAHIGGHTVAPIIMRTTVTTSLPNLHEVRTTSSRSRRYAAPKRSRSR